MNKDIVCGLVRAHRRQLLALALILLAGFAGLLTPLDAGVGGLVIMGLGFSNLLTPYWQTSGGFTLFNTYTAAKSVIPPQMLVQLAPNYLFVGKKLRVTVRGGISNIVTTPGTMAFQIMIGTIVAWTSGNIQLNATAHTTLPFELVVDLRVDSIGSGTAAKFLGMGTLKGIMFTLTAAQVDAVNTSGAFMVPATAPAVGTGFDSTIANILDFWTGFSISNAGNGVQVWDYFVEEMN